MATRSYVPDVGDVVWLEFDPQAGHEQAGHRPALVVSPASYNAKTGVDGLLPNEHQDQGTPLRSSNRGRRYCKRSAFGSSQITRLESTPCEEKGFRAERSDGSCARENQGFVGHSVTRKSPHFLGDFRILPNECSYLRRSTNKRKTNPVVLKIRSAQYQGRSCALIV